MTSNQSLDEFNRKIEHALEQSRLWNDRAAKLIAERDAPKRKEGKEDAAKMAARALEWLSSPEGQESMRKAAAESDEFLDALKKSRLIPWEKLHEPFTI